MYLIRNDESYNNVLENVRIQVVSPQFMILMVYVFCAVVLRPLPIVRRTFPRTERELVLVF